MPLDPGSPPAAPPSPVGRGRIAGWGPPAERPLSRRKRQPRLTAEERALYDDLRDHRIGRNLRLEQERIGYGWVASALGEAGET